MNTRKFLSHFIIISLLLFFGCAEKKQGDDSIFQYSILEALLQGNYDGDLSFGELKEMGDFGLGTFNHLNGEMIAADGIFYQIKSDGKAYVSQNNQKTPFAVVCHFQEDTSYKIDQNIDFNGLQRLLDSTLSSKNRFYAFRIEGTFKLITTRSVPEQKKPYPPLAEVIKYQPTFELKDIKGSLIGFRFPDYMKDLNVPAYHFHFISDDKTQGGHVLSLSASHLRVSLDIKQEYQLKLPHTESFKQIDFTISNPQESGERKIE